MAEKIENIKKINSILKEVASLSEEVKSSAKSVKSLKAKLDEKLKSITAKKAVVLCFLRIAENILETIMIPQTNPKPREANKRIAVGLFRR